MKINDLEKKIMKEYRKAKKGSIRSEYEEGMRPDVRDIQGYAGTI